MDMVNTWGYFVCRKYYMDEQRYEMYLQVFKLDISWVRYRAWTQEDIFISPSIHVLFCLLYKQFTLEKRNWAEEMHVHKHVAVAKRLKIHIELLSNLSSTKVNASWHKSMQVVATQKAIHFGQGFKFILQFVTLSLPFSL
jgi:hypothetical protein